MSDFSHLDDKGRARMVDVSGKEATDRLARAEATLELSEELYHKLQANDLEKGDALATSRIAAIQAAKKTAETIPLCHPLPLTHIDVDFHFDPPHRLVIRTTVKTRATTGVEMEALHAAAVAALTVYDMGKAIDKGIVIREIKLLEKHGGKSGHWKRDDHE